MPKSETFDDKAQLPRSIVILLIIIALLVLGGGSGIVYYAITSQAAATQATATAVVQSNIAAHATATAQSRARATAIAQAHANATATAQARTLAHAHATATAQAHATAIATAVASQNPYPPHSGTLILNDPLTDNSRGYQWDQATLATIGTCGFTARAYHVHAFQKGISCSPEATNLVLSNFTFEVKLTLVQGDQEGIVFRLNQSTGASYAFAILATQGSYIFYTSDGTHTKTLLQGSNAAIKKGLNQSNLVTVVAIGNTFSFYVNNQLVAQGSDNTFSQGRIGILAINSKGSGPADVVASNARVWA